VTSERPAARLVEDPGAERRDQPGLLRDGDELVRRDVSLVGMRPADQCLRADDAASAQLDLRLVVDREAVVGQRVPEVLLELEAADDERARGLREELDAVLAGVLGLVHRHVGVAQQLLGQAVLGADAAADAGADVAALARDRERLAQRPVQPPRDPPGSAGGRRLGDQSPHRSA
jgi:hypothetical protein